MSSEILRRHHVKVFGKGTQTLLFAHGLACDHKVWRLLTPSFENQFQIVLFDYIGSGETDKSFYQKEKYASLKGYSADIVAICEDLNLRDVIFVGHSVSAIIGLLAAIDQPDLFSKLIMIGPSPRYINEKNYFGGFEQEEIARLLLMMETNYIQWAGFFSQSAMANPGRPELSEDLNDVFCNADPAITCDLAKLTFLGDNRQDLPKLQIPSLILQSADDIVAPNQVGDYMHKQMPGSTLYKMKATGHFPHLSAPDETVDLIKKYLQEGDHFN